MAGHNHANWEERMIKTLKGAVAALAMTSVMAGAAFARDLVINFDDLNPGPKNCLLYTSPSPRD